MTKLIILLLIISASYEGATQTDTLKNTCEYRVKAAGIKVGKLKISSIAVGNTITYKMDSESRARLLGVHIITHLEAEYQNGELVKSLSQKWKNEKLIDETVIEKVDSIYLVVKNGVTTQLKDTITYSTILLYFEKPVEGSLLFSESAIDFKPLVNIGDATFQVSHLGGNSDRYIYKNEILEKVILKNKYYNVVIDKRKVKGG